VIFGPTAVGKSDVLFSLLDRRFEIVNADSMQVYRGMDVGTAKPSAELASRLPHHLLSVLDPSEQYSAGEFVRRAEDLIPEICGRARHPVICGGSAFYIRSFLFGLPEAPKGSVEVRSRLRKREKAEGREALYGELTGRDPSARGRIRPHDRNRIIRALEILEVSGRSMFSYHWPKSIREDFRFLLIGLELPRTELYRRIDARVEKMFRDGLVEEIRRLMEEGHGREEPGMQGIGYHEFFQMQKGCRTVPEVKEIIKMNSRRYAKRQLTFFRSIPNVAWVNAEDRGGIRSLVEGFIA
jgi:tRNA dimethylallyltransferase